MSKIKTMKFITLLTGLFSLATFIYKLGLGIYSSSLILIIASISTLIVAICKLTFVKSATKTRASKKKAYLLMTMASTVYVSIFMLFVVLKVNGIDISSQKTYSGWLGGLLIGFMVVMFILSIIKLRGALERSDLMVIGLKEIIYISALSDLVIIENYAYGMFLNYQEDHIIFATIDKYTALAVGAFMILVIISMYIRYFRYKIEQ